MKLADFLKEKDLHAVLSELEQPATVHPPKAKGVDAILVHGYFVRGHWRRRWYPPLKLAANQRRAK